MGFNEYFEMYSKGSELLLGAARSGNTNDRDEGIRLLKNAGNNGITRASYLLGKYYETIEDYQEGAKWYSKAVDDPDCGDEAHTTLELWILQRKIRSMPSTTATSPAPATPSAPVQSSGSSFDLTGTEWKEQKFGRFFELCSNNIVKEIVRNTGTWFQNGSSVTIKIDGASAKTTMELQIVDSQTMKGIWKIEYLMPVSSTIGEFKKGDIERRDIVLKRQ